MITLSEDQASAVEKILDWFAGPRQTLTLGGFAGTGKSTVVSALRRELPADQVRVCAYTGKAVSVLRAKGITNACTMHRVIYAVDPYCAECEIRVSEEKCPKCNSDEHLKTRWNRVPAVLDKLVIVDEASMLTTEHVADLESLAPKILYVGDHGQLEPIGDDPGIMREPELRLEQVHRQAEGSAILDFAHAVRRGGHPAQWESRGDVVVRHGLRGVDLGFYDAVLCGFNNTRVAVNNRIREIRGFAGKQVLCEGERVICLQNDSELGLWNGILGTVTRVRTISEDFLSFDFVDDSGVRHIAVPALRKQFGLDKKIARSPKGVALFDYGYAMTVHKFQGSEDKKIAVLEQIGRSWSSTRWRYTAATRASQVLHYFLSDKGHRR